MSNYTDFLQKTESKKIVLVEIDRGEVLSDSLWIKHAPGVWKTTYAWESGKSVETTAYGVGTWGAGTYGKASATTLPPSPRDKAQLISSLEVDTIYYTLVSSLAAVATTPDSFYWSQSEQLLYINYDGVIRETVINLGLTIGFSSESLYFNNIFYDGRIKSIPNMSVKRDNLFDSKVVTAGGTISLINTDGYFDHFGDQDVYGKKMRIKFGGDDLIYDDYETIYTGYIEKYDLKGSDIVINIKDERKNLERKIPDSYYSIDEYPYVSNTGSEISIGYGVINRAPAVCTNEELTVSTYNFKIVDTTYHDIESIGQVYVDGMKVTHSDADLTEATFNLTSTVYEPGQKVSVSFNGYTDGSTLIENPLDIIEDLLEIYSNTIYSSDFYNTTDWDVLRSTLDDINLFVQNGKTLKEIIGDIAHSILGTFIVEGDGRFNMKVVDLSKTSVKTIPIIDLIKAPIQNNSSNEYISSTRVGYSEDYTEKIYSYFTNTDQEEELVTKYRSYKQKDFHTLLTSAAVAEDYSVTVMSLFGGIVPEYTITTKMQHIDVELEDNINVELYKFYDGAWGSIKCEVVEKNVNYTSNTITFKLKWVEDLTTDINLAKLIKWKPGITYTQGSVTSSGSRLWIATEVSSGETPLPGSDFWNDFGKMYWVDFVQYYTGDLVVWDGIAWQAVTDNLDDEPGVGTGWEVFSSDSVFPSDEGLIAHYSLDDGQGIGGAVATYHLDGNALDSSGNGNHGTETGTIEYDDNCLKIDTTTSYLGMESTPFRTDSFSVSMRFKTNGLGAWSTTVMGLMSITYGSTLTLLYDNRISFSTHDGISHKLVYTEDVFDDEWHHIVVTYNSSDYQKYMYLDNELVAQENSQNIWSWTNDFRIGVDTNGVTTRSFNGLIDEVFFFDRALSDAEITELYNNPSNKNLNQPDLPTSGLVGEWLLNGNSNDTSGNGYNGVDTDVTYVQGRKDNLAGSFNGTSSYISTAFNLPNPTDKYITMIGSFIWDGTGGGGGASGRYFIFESTPNYAIYCEIQADSTLRFGIHRANVDSVVTVETITPNKWYNFVCTVIRNTEAHIYLNGVDVAISSTLYDEDIISTTGLVIGSYRNANDRWFNGEIENIKIYNRILSEQEILALAEKTNPVKDNSGNNNDGYSVGQLSSVQGVSGKANDFNNNQIIKTTLSGDMETLSFWANDYLNIGTENGHVAISPEGGESLVGFGGMSSSFTDETLTMWDASSTGSTYMKSSIPTGNNHFVFVWNGTNYEIFMNGVLQTTYIHGSPVLIALSDFEIGGRYTHSNYFTGLIDEVRVYNRALSPEEIRGLYKYKAKASFISDSESIKKDENSIIEKNLHIKGNLTVDGLNVLNYSENNMGTSHIVTSGSVWDLASGGGTYAVPSVLDLSAFIPDGATEVTLSTIAYPNGTSDEPVIYPYEVTLSDRTNVINKGGDLWGTMTMASGTHRVPNKVITKIGPSKKLNLVGGESGSTGWVHYINVMRYKI